MKKYFLSAAIIAIAIISGSVISMDRSRYEVVPLDGSVYFKVDTYTGEVEWCRRETLGSSRPENVRYLCLRAEPE